MAPFRTRHQTFNNTKILYPPKTNWCYSPFDKSEEGRRNSKEYTRSFWWPVTGVTGVQRKRNNKKMQRFWLLITESIIICFQGNNTVIWIGTGFKKGIAAVRLKDLEQSATGLWAYWLLILSLCVPLSLTHTASGLWTAEKALRTRVKQIHLHFFLWQQKLAGEIGGCAVWQLGCSAIYWWETPGAERSTPEENNKVIHMQVNRG